MEQVLVLRAIYVAVNAVQVRDVYTLVQTGPAGDDPVGPAIGIERSAAPNQYDLATALLIVRRMETSAGRAAVFTEITNKNRLYRLIDKLYAMAGARLLQPLVLFAYMLKCVLSVGSSDVETDDAEAVAISNFPNEHHTVERVAALVPEVRLLHLSISRRHVLGRGQLTAAIAMLRSSLRIWAFLRVLVRRHSFMPAARIASALAFYLRFSHLFAGRQALHAAIIASNYSPEAVGMAAAAHRMGRRVVYANHAPVPANGAVVPPVLADCALFYGVMTAQIYERRSRCTAEVALIGQPGSARAMEWRDKVETIGIFLTSGTRADVLKSLIATIRMDLPVARIIIRQHPVTLLKTDFSGIGVDDPYTELTIGNPLDDEIVACDLVICGNSGVALNVLCGGRPVAYLSSLDGILFDANGFVASRLVYSMPWWSDDIYGRLQAFYRRPGWQDVMRSYDASSGADIALLKHEAAQMLLRHIRPAAGGDQPIGRRQSGHSSSVLGGIVPRPASARALNG